MCLRPGLRDSYLLKAFVKGFLSFYSLIQAAILSPCMYCINLSNLCILPLYLSLRKPLKKDKKPLKRP